MSSLWFSFLIAVLRLVLRQTNLSAEQRESFIDFVVLSQKDPQPSRRLHDLITAAEEALKQELERQDSRQVTLDELLKDGEGKK